MNKENFEEKLNTWTNDIKNIKMTDAEKERMLLNIKNSPGEPALSPFRFEFTLSVFQKKHLRAFQYISIACLVLLLSGGGVGMAAIGTLPGNTLYGVKVNMLEPAKLFFKFSPESKAEYESSLAYQRLMEAETLAESGNLDDSKEEVLSSLLEHHTNSLNGYRGKFKENENSAKVDDEIVSGFETKVNAHMEKLDRIRNTESDSDIAEKKETRISKTAKASVEKVKSVKNIRSQNQKD